MRTAARASGVASAAASGSGVRSPMAGTTTQSGGARPCTGKAGTSKPCELRTRRSKATTRTSNISDASPSAAVSSLAIANASSTAARPVSKTPLRTSTSIFMETSMIKLAFFARFEAKPGKEEAVAKFLEMALDMAKKEPTTINWYALRLSPSTFGVFDTFNDEDGRQKHLNGPIGQALMAKAPELFSSPPSIEPVELLGSK